MKGYVENYRRLLANKAGVANAQRGGGAAAAHAENIGAMKSVSQSRKRQRNGHGIEISRNCNLGRQPAQ